ncbi:addiction module protein [candidate division KSB1 bacterium]|nr:addiction module protein [candidate division KSB1 bacterium]MBL7093509.1 addiction module protein [candidate division KSB1 bacterium]
MNSETLYEDAVKLKPAERLHLIEKLAESLSKPDKDIERIWAEESEKRYEALKAGKVKTVSLNEIINRYK